jgi:ABC-type sugar transport system permease subunit
LTTFDVTYRAVSLKRPYGFRLFGDKVIKTNNLRHKMYIYLTPKIICTIVSFFIQIVTSMVFRLDNHDLLLCPYSRCTMERWWKGNCTMMKTRWNDGQNTMVWCVFSPSYHRVYTNLSSPFHHWIITFSPSYHRLFIIVLSYFQWNEYCKNEYCKWRNEIFGQKY